MIGKVVSTTYTAPARFAPGKTAGAVPAPTDSINDINFAPQLRSARTRPSPLRDVARRGFDAAVQLLEQHAPKLCYSIPGALVGAMFRPLYKSPAAHFAPETRVQAPPVSLNHAEFVFGDEPTLQRALDLIRNAESSILFETFLLNGPHGRQITDALIEKAKSIPVHVILDPVMQAQEAATRKGEPEYHLSARLTANGVSVTGYDVELLDRNVRASDHTKMLIVDGSKGLVGGTNFDNMFNQDANVVLQGPAVGEFTSLFRESWEASGGIPFTLPAPLPTSPEVQATTPTRVLCTDPVRRNLKPALLEQIRQADQSIDIAMFAFADPEVRDAVLEARERNVQVRVLLDPGETVFGMKNVGFPNQGTRVILEDAGIELRYYKSEPGQQFHTKMAIFDRERVLLGSTNFIPGAFENIKELSVELQGEQASKPCTEFFEQCWANSRPPEPLTPGGRIWGGVVDFLSSRML